MTGRAIVLPTQDLGGPKLVGMLREKSGRNGRGPLRHRSWRSVNSSIIHLPRLKTYKLRNSTVAVSTASHGTP